MDDLAALLDGPRARGAFTLKVVMAAPWRLDVADEAPLTVLAITTGEAYVQMPGEPATTLGAGDIALLRGPAPYVVADSRDTAPQVRILPGQICVDAQGAHLAQTMRFGVNTWGNDDAGDTTMLVGTYHSDGELGRRLLDALPPMLVLRAESWTSPVVELLGTELSAGRAGQAAALDRLVDLLVIDIVRAWTDADPLAARRLTGSGDECVAEALRLIQDSCDRPWTVAGLARRVGLSRAAFARRFTDTVGMAPIGYLTEYRMALAADLLREPGASVASVAGRVGYPSPFTFSAAYKRHFGSSPRHHVAASG